MFPFAHYTPYAEKGTGQRRGFGMTKGRKRKHVYEKCVKKRDRERLMNEVNCLNGLFFSRVYSEVDSFFYRFLFMLNP